ncbi:DegV family protein, partial [Crossiella equi]|uniref:DegV family protein n=1 Tax=Crossiella equi TaxID=130796 RepID=UPI001177F647
MSVAVFTDSTAYLPEGFAARHGVHEVPLHVTVDGTTGLDGKDVGPAELAAALAARHTVTTSRPTPAEFAEAYDRALTAGADAVVSIHLSRELSGTWDAARLAALEVGPDRVRVVDSRSTAMGLGFAVLAAARAATEGAHPKQVEDTATTTATHTRTFFCLETLEHLRRGGRITPTAALLGTALAVKPLLHVDNGRILPLEKVRTTSRAVARLVDLAATAAGQGPVSVAVHHLGSPQRAAELAGRLDDRLPGCDGCVISEVGAVVEA